MSTLVVFTLFPEAVSTVKTKISLFHLVRSPTLSPIISPLLLFQFIPTWWYFFEFVNTLFFQFITLGIRLFFIFPKMVAEQKK